MELIAIFAEENKTTDTNLWAIIHDGCLCDELETAFDNWNDPEYLLDFFSDPNNYEDLANGFYSINSVEDAIDKTLEEASILENILLDASYGKKIGEEVGLNNIFKPLNVNDYRFHSDLQMTKARLNWLRIYSIKVHPIAFVVSGSAIKLVEKMNTPYLEQQLNKLDKVRGFLFDNGYINSDDLKKNL